MFILIIILIFIIIGLCLYIYNQKQKIQHISQQINHILFQQDDFYIQKYKEGILSILESDICKLVNKIYEQNHLLENEKLILKEYLEDISHQMKTPLTSLNLIHERLLKANDIEKRQLLKDEKKLLDKIEWLVMSLLKMAQLDAQTVTFHQESITQKDFISRLLNPFEIQIDMKDIQLQINIQESEIFKCDILWTLEALSNILKNCIEHVEQNGMIQIEMNQNPLYDEIIIQDNGCGIDQEDLIHLFERFYKGKNAKQDSIGIGLALSSMIIEKQNGTIQVENTYPGTKFTIHLYKENV